MSRNALILQSCAARTLKLALRSVPTAEQRRSVGGMMEATAVDQDAKKARPRPMRINMNATKCYAVWSAVDELKLQVVEDDTVECDIYWFDVAKSASIEWHTSLAPDQIINQLYGTEVIGRKDSLARNIQSMQETWKEGFDFTPRTWVLPSGRASLVEAMRGAAACSHKTFIVKPSLGGKGEGIRLLMSPELVPQREQIIVQEYIEKPLLMEGFKFDLRLYVLVTSCSPLRVFLYGDGLVRLSTVPYLPPVKDNLDDVYMHLTNYSINRHSAGFKECDDPDKGSKRSVKFLMNWMEGRGYKAADVWKQIEDVMVKTLIVAQPHLQEAYSKTRPSATRGDKSFQILGCDVLIDENLKVWLLEVNRSPSFASSMSKMDFHIKHGLVKDALQMVLASNSGTEAKQCSTPQTDYVQIYPSLDSDRQSAYTQMLKDSSELKRQKEFLKWRPPGLETWVNR